jgi:hypothetical protein
MCIMLLYSINLNLFQGCMMSVLDEIYEKHIAPAPPPEAPVKSVPDTVTLTARISPECKFQLKFVASFLGTRMSPLMYEIIEKSVHELFQRADFSEEDMKKYSKGLAEYLQRLVE